MDEATIKRVWDRFGPEGQNMSFTEFRREIQDLTDPIKLQQDLADIELRKARERTNRIRIDNALNFTN